MADQLEHRLREYRATLDAGTPSTGRLLGTSPGAQESHRLRHGVLAGATAALLLAGVLISTRHHGQGVHSLAASVPTTTATTDTLALTAPSLTDLANDGLTTSAQYGDSHPTRIEAVKTTFQDAFSLADPLWTPGDPLPGYAADKPVWVVQVYGTYSIMPAGSPDDSANQTAGAITMIIDAATGLPLGGSKPTTHIQPLDRAGAEIQLNIPDVVQAPRPVDPRRIPGAGPATP